MMNYAAAFAQALNEFMDEAGIKKQGPYGIKRLDPSKVVSVTFDGEEEGGYSEYTNWSAKAILEFRGTRHDVEVEGLRGEKYTTQQWDYWTDIDLHQLGAFDIGKTMERAIEIMINGKEST